MTEMQVCGFQVWLDPDAVTKLEITDEDNAGILVKIFLQGKIEPCVLKFANKQKALDFYAAVWALRDQSGEGDDADDGVKTDNLGPSRRTR